MTFLGENLKMKYSQFALVLLCCLLLTSCKFNKNDKNILPNMDESELPVAENKQTHSNIITENMDKYPREIRIFQDKAFTDRLKALTGEEYQTILNNFDTETPIVAEMGTYKFTGCKAHDCVGFKTTFLYDSYEDNLNVVVSREGKVKVYDEKGKITVTKSLQLK